MTLPFILHRIPFLLSHDAVVDVLHKSHADLTAMGDHARQRVREKSSWSVIGVQYDALYRSVTW